MFGGVVWQTTSESFVAVGGFVAGDSLLEFGAEMADETLDGPGEGFA